MSNDIKPQSSSGINNILLIRFQSNPEISCPPHLTHYDWYRDLQEHHLFALIQRFCLIPTKSPDCTFLLVPDVIVPAEDHSSFAEAGAADLSQLSLAAGALKAACVPVPIHGEEQEAIRDPTSAACAGAHRPATTSRYRDSSGFHTAVHHRLPAG